MNVIPKLILCLILAVPWQNSFANPSNWDSNIQEQVQVRLENMDHLYPMVNQAEVLEQIRRYLLPGRKNTEYMMGRSKRFFPIFEQQLTQAGLPQQLKFIPIIESGMRVTAMSPVGARGLWQLMGTSGRHYELNVSEKIDERLDIYKSTQAAINMLNDLYDRFGDWSLVLAAYNCGPGRVLKAIKTANSSHYSKIAPLLPKETQKYLVRFTAAAYVANFYEAHGLEAVGINPIWDETGMWLTHNKLSFRQITEATGLNYAHISQLNPGATNGYWPSSESGNFIILPKTAISQLKEFVEEKAGPQVVFVGEQPSTYHLSYEVAPGDDVESIADQFGILPEDLLRWNAIPDGKIYTYQVLDLYVPPTFSLNRA